MTRSERFPGSREDDAWLSDEQLAQCVPAELEPFHSPVPTRMVSNGEYMPIPQTKKQKHVEHRTKELAEAAAKKLGISRRQFLAGTGGLAASFLAMNEVFGQRFFNVNPVELFETAAYAESAVPADVFVFDDQTHIVRTANPNPSGPNGASGNALRALAQGPGPASTAAGFTYNPFNGTGGNAAGVDELGSLWTDWNPAQLQPDSPPNPGPDTTALGEFALGQYINRLYLEAQTSCSIISNANIALFLAPGQKVPKPARNVTESLVSEILTGWQTSQCRDFINNLAGSKRAFAHAQLYPGVGNLEDPAFGDYTQWQVEFCKPDSWKGYNIAYAASPFPGAEFKQWALDSESLAYPMYSVIKANKHMLAEYPGFFNICVHKGLQADLSQPFGSNDTPQNGNPDDVVKAATDWPEFNFIIYHSCIRPSFFALQSLIDIENRHGAMPPTTLRDSHGHVVPNIRWSTQLAQIAGGRYDAGAEPSSRSPSSHTRLPNVYAELGTTLASMIVTFPTVCAHLLGQLIYYMGSDHVVFGSDSNWYGGPQWQIDALWRFQIPDVIADRYHYAPITEADKRNILGLNSARLYGLTGAKAIAIGQKGSAYKAGSLPDYYPLLQPGTHLDNVLSGPGYPVPITPVAGPLVPNDRLTKLRQEYSEMGLGRSNVRNGWMRV
jgi:uncharacterized protein